jgi:hypothetical protein
MWCVVLVSQHLYNQIRTRVIKNVDLTDSEYTVLIVAESVIAAMVNSDV